MRAGQRLKANDGLEVMLFPLPYIRISQGEGGSYSHAGVLAIDFLGWTSSGRLLRAPMYAPCSCKCVAIIDNFNNGRVFESLERVHTPNGIGYVTFMCFHDNNPVARVGDTFRQGDIFAHTGTAGNVTGDHTHFNTANGKYSGWENVPPQNHGQLKNSTHVYNTCYVNDTVISIGYSYNWREFTGGVTPTDIKKKYPWFILSNKLRSNYRIDNTR